MTAFPPVEGRFDVMSLLDGNNRVAHGRLSTEGALRVALALPSSQAFIERIKLGILDYAQRAGGWRMTLNPEGGGLSLRDLSGWEGDGILGFVETRADANALSEFRCPVVNLSARMRLPSVVSVGSDNFEVGRIAAAHLRERGFEQYAFYGLRGVWYSEERMRGFQSGLRSADPFTALLSRSRGGQLRGWDSDSESLEQWLLSIGERGPAGIFCAHDYRALFLMETARRIGFKIPSDLAVLGVNDDPVSCGGAVPALSSIPQDGFSMGVIAAGLLEKWIQTGVRPIQPLGIRPLRVVERASTDVVGVGEPRMRCALGFIEKSLPRSFGVEEVARSAGVSRRWLEHRFMQLLGVTPHEYIMKRRLRRVQILSREKPNLSRSELALEAGFSSVRALRSALNVESSRD